MSEEKFTHVVQTRRGGTSIVKLFLTFWFHTTTRELQTCTFEGPGTLKNKFQRRPHSFFFSFFLLSHLTLHVLFVLFLFFVPKNICPEPQTPNPKPSAGPPLSPLRWTPHPRCHFFFGYKIFFFGTFREGGAFFWIQKTFFWDTKKLFLGCKKLFLGCKKLFSGCNFFRETKFFVGQILKHHQNHGKRK